MQQVTTRSLTPLEYSVTALAWQINNLLNLFLHLHLYLTPLFPDLLQPWGTTLSFPSTPCIVPSLPPCCLHAFCGTLTCEDQLRCFSGGTIRSDSLTLEFLGLLGCASLAALAFCVALVRVPFPPWLRFLRLETVVLEYPHVCVLRCFSHAQLFAVLWTRACQAPLFMGFSRQEYWSGLPCPPSGDRLVPGIEPASLTFPALAGRHCSCHLGSPHYPHNLKEFMINFLWIKWINKGMFIGTQGSPLSSLILLTFFFSFITLSKYASWKWVLP